MVGLALPSLRHQPQETPVAEKINAEALSAAVAGFLACQVLTVRFLVQEGIVDKDRFIGYLEGALQELAPGIDDPRALYALHQLLASLRSPNPDVGLQ